MAEHFHQTEFQPHMPFRRIIKKIILKHYGATKIALIYFLVSFIWILFSDKLASDLFTAEQFEQVQTFKGWFFISVSSVLIYMLVRSYIKENLDYQETLRKSRKSYMVLASNLAESEKRLRKILQEAPIPVILISNDNRIQLLSSTFTNETGYTVQDLPDIQSLEEILPGKNKEGLRELIRKTQTTKSQQLEEEIEILARNGTKRIWNISSSPLQFEDGTLNITMMAMDITVLRKAEERLSQSNQSLRVLIDCNQAIYRNKNFTDLLDEITRVLVQIGHYTYAWAGRWHDGQFIPLADYGEGIQLSNAINKFLTTDKAGKRLRSQLEKGQHFVCRDLRQDPDCPDFTDELRNTDLKAAIVLPLMINDHLWGLLNLFESHDRSFGDDEVALLNELNKDISYAIGTMVILNEKKNVEREKLELQHEQKKLLRQLQAQIDNMPMGLILTDKAFKITFLNPEAEKIFGYEQ